ncbi:hypothetical protein BHE74_00042226 [Ensete ventricosum]|nr:hypothetical protein GW17_00037285 [Ensete ventricosum]RWW51428.1 hypothetical protein BHE74_00042226 [Ensete ventricosum]
MTKTRRRRSPPRLFTSLLNALSTRSSCAFTVKYLCFASSLSSISSHSLRVPELRSKDLRATGSRRSEERSRLFDHRSYHEHGDEERSDLS